MMMPRTSDVIAGKYMIVRVLGEGGMGIVYEATHQRLRQRVAIKMLLPAMLEHPVIVSRFEREARAAAQLRGRHVARVNDVDVTADGVPYMVMDFLEGHDLQVEMERRGRLPIPESVDVILQACAAMVEAHQLGIVHRDLKPSNLFLEIEPQVPAAPRAAPGRIVKVLDFGISKVAPHAEGEEGKLTEADTIMGTANYMSPEQVKAQPVDARADIWALGVILYEALAGRVPWLGAPAQVAAAIVSEDAPDIRSYCPTVTAELARVIHRALSRSPHDRFQDVRSFAVALAPFAHVGSIGRNFAEGIVASGSYPRGVAVTPSGDSSPIFPSMPPANDTGENAKTVLNAPGVAQELMRAHDARSSPSGGGSSPAQSTGRSTHSRGRAALIGVLVAFVFGVITIGGVVLFVRPRMIAKPASISAIPSSVPTPSPSTSVTAAVTPASPSTEPASEPASNTEQTPASSAKPATTKPATTTTAKASSTKPAAPTSAVKPVPSASSAPPDKPLFL